MDRPKRVQLHVQLPYKKEPKEHVRVARLLEQGWAIVQLQRLTDRDAVITLAPPEPVTGAA